MVQDSYTSQNDSYWFAAKSKKVVKNLYENELFKSEEFLNPIRWENIDVDDYDAIYLPGGHRSRGMKSYLESSILQQKIAEFFSQQKVVGAICHGVLLVARSKNINTNKSVIYDYKTTALTWELERNAWNLTKYTGYWDSNYYRTYMSPTGQTENYMSVEEEVKRNLANSDDFKKPDKHWKNIVKNFRNVQRYL